jgi:cellobiose phosphorylase
MSSNGFVLRSPSGLRAQVGANGSLQVLQWRELSLNLFPAHALERGPTQVVLRRHAQGGASTLQLLGPQAELEARRHSLTWHREWDGLRIALTLRLARSQPAWFWHVELHNAGERDAQLDLLHHQDLALSGYAALRLNEYYVSQYLDHTPLSHPERGWVVATRQNLALQGEHPWCLIGSLQRGAAFATDALQLRRLHAAGHGDLPSARLQHEHAMASIQDERFVLPAGAKRRAGFFGGLQPHHAEPTHPGDVGFVDELLALPEAQAPGRRRPIVRHAMPRSLFDTAPSLASQDLASGELETLFGDERRQAEFAEGRLLSFFHGEDRHVVLQAKERAVLRPHGHLLRTGSAWVADESALASTAWMAGVFHSMVTQGHVALNRLLSTHRSYVGLFRSLGQRLFVEVDGGWRLLDVPSAWEMSPRGAHWYYRHAGGLICVDSIARTDSQVLELRVQVLEGEPLRLLLSHHLALDGDDGASGSPMRVHVEATGALLRPPRGSELARRFPQGFFRIEAHDGTALERVGGDEMLYLDGRSRGQPWMCMLAAPATSAGWRITGHLVPEQASPADAGRDFWHEAGAGLRLHAPAKGDAADDVRRLGEWMPWLAHDALVHYLSPRGLEQFSGGGWGTRDVCQGPVEYLLALGRTAAVRDLLLKVFRAQNADGDWPQWFAFFERDRGSRASDSHGDIVFWPLLALGQYLQASGDASLLDEALPFHAGDDEQPEQGPLLGRHVARALALIARRRIKGTALAAYGHGDWNDSLQPADPSMREHLCSAWTVTLHAQTLATLADGLRRVHRDDEAAALEREGAEVAQAFQRWLVVDGVIPGYVHFHPDGRVEHMLLHPRDDQTGLRYSLLPMIHAVINELLTPEQAQAHLDLIRRHLAGPDGARLFDRPMRYRGGAQRFFQRAETSSFFGREIGLMYMHAHLRYAEALWHHGDARGFLEALRLANPIGLREHVPMAALRQSNCYYSSSDAVFADRYEADARYPEVIEGRVPLEGGWRVYSSGAGIAFGLVHKGLLGVRMESDALVLDPVLTRDLNGLRATLQWRGCDVELRYAVAADGAPVRSVTLNGHGLAFERLANRYRIGAARLSLSVLSERLVPGLNRLEIDLR